MVKTKFQTLSKEDKKKEKDNYFKTQVGKSVKSKLNRLLLYGILLIVLGIWLIIDAIINNYSSFQIAYACLLIIVAFIFIIGRHYVMIKKVNEFIINKKRKK